MKIINLETSCRKITKTVGNFHVLEYFYDASVSPANAMNEYYMSKMNVRRRQVVIEISHDHWQLFKQELCSGWVVLCRQPPV